jgi:predicted MPP superfamily phosphohydrolase
MRARILSDLHFEFHADHGISFLNSIDKNGQDVVLMAGDISDAMLIEESIQLVCSHWDPTPVIYVAGNHDYYLSRINPVLDRFRQLEKEIHNFKFLENDITNIMGKRILGTTLWFNHSGNHELYDNMMSDFLQIGSVYLAINKLGVMSIDFLRQEIKPGDIILTHHMPHRTCILPKFIGSPLNKYFVHYEAEKLIENTQVTWIHGHTHSFINQTLQKSRIVCNAFGYVGEITGFKPDFILDL